MSFLDEYSVFTSLNQQGPLAVSDAIDISRPFRRENRAWVGRISVHEITLTKYRALRKLSLMSLAGSIDQRERETDIEEKFPLFLNFLNRYVWSTSLKIGEHDIVYLLSHHRTPDFSCDEVNVIRREDVDAVLPEPGRKLTLLKQRDSGG